MRATTLFEPLALRTNTICQVGTAIDTKEGRSTLRERLIRRTKPDRSVRFSMVKISVARVLPG